ncbi:DNA polymerase III, delta subunit [Clostridium cavendishii DSM 21758]|uniref:DNA polymerase III subunit delta n=1 Tax=Clostridium cavendishii DSM 21758 TaxID=1121302 RepID=A0A1M6APK5_9CLOT|nr:DNA polymerase III subunit delta [Clostridium cavendishii]SHI38416.1 DNA polymerase III, delta subunit [Clostridium cavendishii DSM 21758]
MIDLEVLEKEVKNNNLKNSYILCGLDEMLIKESIDMIIDKAIDLNFKDLNLVKFDGNNMIFEDFMNACETLPFMSEKKVVVVCRATYLKDKADSQGTKLFSQIEEYIKNTPSHCILIQYVLLNDKRDTLVKNKKIMKFDKSAVLVKADKLRGEKLNRKIMDIFNKHNKNIGKIELKYFADLVPNNFNIIEREIEKLVSYTNGREITRHDIDLLLPNKSENDAFDLVEYISIKKPEKAIDLMNELLHKGENMMLILSLIENQFKKLFMVKVYLQEKKSKEEMIGLLKVPPFICEKLILQSKKFTIQQIQKCMKLCVNAEKSLKSSSIDKKIEMELMIINTVRD